MPFRLGTYWEYTTGCYVIDNDRAPVNLTIPRGNAASIVVGSNEEELFMAGGLERLEIFTRYLDGEKTREIG